MGVGLPLPQRPVTTPRSLHALWQGLAGSCLPGRWMLLLHWDPTILTTQMPDQPHCQLLALTCPSQSLSVAPTFRTPPG